MPSECKRLYGENTPARPMTRGNAAGARVRLIVWRLECQHQIEPDPAEMALRYGTLTDIPDWRARPFFAVRAAAGRSRYLVTGTERR
jgi:hypothetical protein